MRQADADRDRQRPRPRQPADERLQAVVDRRGRIPDRRLPAAPVDRLAERTGSTVTGPTSRKPKPNWASAGSATACASSPAPSPTGPGKARPKAVRLSVSGGSIWPMNRITADPSGSSASRPIAPSVRSRAVAGGSRRAAGGRAADRTSQASPSPRPQAGCARAPAESPTLPAGVAARDDPATSSYHARLATAPPCAPDPPGARFAAAGDRHPTRARISRHRQVETQRVVAERREAIVRRRRPPLPGPWR